MKPENSTRMNEITYMEKCDINIIKVMRENMRYMNKNEKIIKNTKKNKNFLELFLFFKVILTRAYILGHSFQDLRLFQDERYSYENSMIGLQGR